MSRRLAPLLICLLLALGGGLATAFHADRTGDPDVLAWVGDRPISRADLTGRGAFRLELELPARAEGSQGGLLQDAIDEELLMQEALRRDLVESDYVVRRRLAMRVVEDEVLTPLAFEVDDAAIEAHYRAQPERYAGPSGQIPFAQCRARVRGDLVREVFTRRYRALLEELRERTEVVLALDDAPPASTVARFR